MSSHLVDGVPLPDRVSGHPALDFCNTRAGWGAALPKEYLTSPRAVVLWAADAGLLPAPPPGRRAAGVDDAEALRRALDLREALYACALGRGGPQEWDAVSREVAAAHAVALLGPGDPGARWRLRPDRATPALALHAAALAAEELLRSPLAGCVGACGGAGCGWLFADPRRRRRWCSMAVCGNRAKARRHAAARRPDPMGTLSAR